MHSLLKYKNLVFTFLLALTLGYFIADKNLIEKFASNISKKLESNSEKVYNASLENYKFNPNKNNIDLDSPLLQEVKKNLDEKFISWKATYTMPTKEELEYSMVKGYVNAYKDPYTQYFPPEEATSFKENVKGSFGGVGMEVGLRDGLITVISPLKDSPAMQAGIKAGDILYKINGEDIYEKGYGVDQAVGKIRGEIGTEVALTLLPKGSKNIKESKEVKIVRQEIKVPTIDSKIVNGVYVISLYSFTAESPNLFKEALIKFADSGLNKLVIDLRGNPGGYLESAVQIASFFLPEGKVIVSERSANTSDTKEHRSFGYNVFGDKLKLSIIIDEGSASASEILAGALQDQKVATVYGQKSYGKGSVQEMVDLKNGGSLKVTIAKWFTPNGRNITEDKIVPDVEVKRDKNTTSESELKTIINLINSKK